VIASAKVGNHCSNGMEGRRGELDLGREQGRTREGGERDVRERKEGNGKGRVRFNLPLPSPPLPP